MEGRCTHHKLGGSTVAEQCPQCLLSVGLMPDQELTAIRPDPADTTSGPGPLTPGAIVAARFRVTAFIGRGGMGEIYRAEDLKLGQPVALRFISHQRPSDDALRFFYDEVRLGRQVAHPSVCRVYDLLEVDGRPFIVMEFVEGEDLASLLGRIGRLSYRKALEVARDVCWGLDAAHEKGIVHGDLKPANIMINGRGRARITDFGLARLADEQSLRSGERLAGTVAYMAPEQFTTRQVNRATDIYSLGLVLYEIFTGRRAHEIVKIEDVQKTLATLPPRPSLDQPRIPVEIEQILLRCLSVDPRDRPDSVRTILAVLGGADAVDTMILAGETPTPEYVAASRKVQPLRRGQALSIFVASFLSLAGILVLSSRLTLYARAELVKSPATLAARARDLAIRFGSAAPVADEGYWFEPDLRYLRRHLSEAAPEGTIRGDPFPPIVFHYRTSRSPLAPLGADGRLHVDDPAPNDPGMVHVALGPTGRLLLLQSFAPSSTVRPHVPVNWSDVIREAGIDATRLVATSTNWNPPLPHDAKLEWRFDRALVRAARYGDHLSEFELVDPAARTPATDADRRLPDILYYVLLAAALVAGAFLARRNVRMKRVDRRGAARLAMWVFLCRFTFGLAASHHPLVIEKEPAHLATIAGAALLLAAEVCLAYVALEPSVRQRWPALMIGWMRFGQGRFRDSIVGREILVGTLAGLVVRLFDHLRNALPLLIPSLHVIPSHLAIQTLASMRDTVGAMFYYQARAIFYGLFGLFLLLLLSMLLRIEPLATIAWIAATTAMWSRWDDLRVDIPIVAIQMTILFFTMKRFGLLCLITAVYIDFLTVQFPLTIDFTRFYFASSAVVLALIVTLIILGFRAAVAERRVAIPLTVSTPQPAL